MDTVTLDEVTRLARQLSPAERLLLIRRLQGETPDPLYPVTRESLQAELQRRRAAGAFDHLESLASAFPDPPLRLTEDEVTASIRDSATEWEQELDEFFGDD